MFARLPVALIVSASLVLPLFTAACEVEHHESTKENLLGGTTHEETTVTKNLDGSLNVEKSKQVTR
jgi:hypothetical protein